MTETEKPSQQQTLSIASFALPLASTDRYLLLKWSYLIQQLINLRVEVNKYTVPNTRRTRTGKSRMLAYPQSVLQKHTVSQIRSQIEDIPVTIPNTKYTVPNTRRRRKETSVELTDLQPVLHKHTAANTKYTVPNKKSTNTKYTVLNTSWRRKVKSIELTDPQLVLDKHTVPNTKHRADRSTVGAIHCPEYQIHDPKYQILDPKQKINQ